MVATQRTRRTRGSDLVVCVVVSVPVAACIADTFNGRIRAVHFAP